MVTRKANSWTLTLLAAASNGGEVQTTEDAVSRRVSLCSLYLSTLDTAPHSGENNHNSTVLSTGRGAGAGPHGRR
eukprot:3785396-Rhodomonas_salina.4